MHATVRVWRSDDNLRSALFLYHVSSQAQTPVILSTCIPSIFTLRQLSQPSHPCPFFPSPDVRTKNASLCHVSLDSFIWNSFSLKVYYILLWWHFHRSRHFNYLTIHQKNIFVPGFYHQTFSSSSTECGSVIIFYYPNHCTVCTHQDWFTHPQAGHSDDVCLLAAVCNP